MSSRVRSLVICTGVVMALGCPSAASAQTLTWGPCDGIPTPFQCATLAVPLDYERPTGPTITLALVRHPAEKPAGRIGSLFMNPGGPGGSGVDLVRFIAPGMPAELRARFDLVGFDPRGVARSRAVKCLNEAEYDQAFARTRLLPAPPSLGSALSVARAFRDACVQRSSDLLPHIGTEYADRAAATARAVLRRRAAASAEQSRHRCLELAHGEVTNSPLATHLT